MFDGRRVNSPGARYIDDINAAKETQYGKFVDCVLRWFQNGNENAAIKRGRSNLWYFGSNALLLVNAIRQSQHVR